MLQGQGAASGPCLQRSKHHLEPNQIFLALWLTDWGRSLAGSESWTLSIALCMCFVSDDCLTQPPRTLPIEHFTSWPEGQGVEVVLVTILREYNISMRGKVQVSLRQLDYVESKREQGGSRVPTEEESKSELSSAHVTLYVLPSLSRPICEVLV
jgi:hypothetical protein